MSIPELFAVHIAEGVLARSWWMGGIFLAIMLLIIAARRLPPEWIPRVGLLTAAFFIASTIHVRVGPTSVHLLLNGLAGLILGYRATLAIFQGLLLQYLLMAHGGLTTLGVNTLILSLPAIAGGMLFPPLMRSRWLQMSAGRWCLVALSASIGIMLVCISCELLIAQWRGTLDLYAINTETLTTLRPIWLAGIFSIAAMIATVERRWETTPGFAVGLLIGVMVAGLTVAGNFLVLLFGTDGDWRTMAVVVLLAHLPIVLIESIIAGCTVSFLLKVQPELLRLPPDIHRSSEKPSITRVTGE